jgi:predicted RNA-binding protein with PIN domain
MASHYFIDGYNVLHKSRSLRPLVHADLESAREALLERVGQFCIATGTHVILVFDGRGRFRAEVAPHHLRVPNMELQFAPEHLTADAVIERLIYQRQHRLDCVVVSNDRGLRDICRGMGALTMEADNFLATIRENRRDISDKITANRTRTDDCLEDFVDGNTIAFLKDLREKL